jgi:hypothetical protein
MFLWESFLRFSFALLQIAAASQPPKILRELYALRLTTPRAPKVIRTKTQERLKPLSTFSSTFFFGKTDAFKAKKKTINQHNTHQ